MVHVAREGDVWLHRGGQVFLILCVLERVADDHFRKYDYLELTRGRHWVDQLTIEEPVFLNHWTRI